LPGDSPPPKKKVIPPPPGTTQEVIKASIGTTFSLIVLPFPPNGFIGLQFPLQKTKKGGPFRINRWVEGSLFINGTVVLMGRVVF